MHDLKAKIQGLELEREEERIEETNDWTKKNEVGFREYNALIEVILYRIMNVKHRENHKRKEEIDQLE